MTSNSPTLRVRVEEVAPGNHRTELLDYAPEPTGLLCWLGEGPQIVAWGSAWQYEVAGAQAIHAAAAEWRELNPVVAGEDELAARSLPTDLPFAPPLAFGSFGFAAATPGYLIVPEVAVVRFGASTWVVTAALGAAPAAGNEVLAAALARRSDETRPRGLWTDPGRMTQGKWEEAVRRLVALLRAGAAAKVVLARDILVTSATQIDERYLARRLRRLYPTTWIYAVAGLIGATPEVLAAVDGDQVRSRILAGTSKPGEGQQLLDSMKDRSEHRFAVESVTRALAPLAADLVVPPEPELLDLPNVTHLATDVRAEIPGASVLDVVGALHPTAAVCGTPTHLAFELLEQFEGRQRGRYSGPVGYVDAAGDGEFGIALRCGQIVGDGKSLRLFAGGGIMPDSVPAIELAETRAKMRPLLDALEFGE